MSRKHSIAKRDRERNVKDRHARKLEDRRARVAKRREDEGTPPKPEDAP